MTGPRFGDLDSDARGHMRLTHLLVLVLLIGMLATAAAQQRVDDTALKSAGKSRGEWLTYGLDYAETRYSPLKQIDASNVNRLSQAWSFDVGVGGGGQEATPLVSNGVVYSITNWSVTFAIDARTGKELWRWDPQVDHALDDPRNDSVCCGPVNRGVGLYEGKVIVPVLDGRLVALDAQTGKVLWSVRALPANEKHTFTIAPRILKNKIIVGSAGGEFFVRGFFAAYDVNSGKKCGGFIRCPAILPNRLRTKPCGSRQKHGPANGGNWEAEAPCGMDSLTIRIWI